MVAAGLFAICVVPSCFLHTLRDRLQCFLSITQVTFVMEKQDKNGLRQYCVKNVLQIYIVRTPRRVVRKKITHFHRLVQ